MSNCHTKFITFFPEHNHVVCRLVKLKLVKADAMDLRKTL
jgi:hypothetical protein